MHKSLMPAAFHGLGGNRSVELKRPPTYVESGRYVSLSGTYNLSMASESRQWRLPVQNLNPFLRPFLDG